MSSLATNILTHVEIPNSLYAADVESLDTGILD
jgi:hypothetical protein